MGEKMGGGSFFFIWSKIDSSSVIWKTKGGNNFVLILFFSVVCLKGTKLAQIIFFGGIGF
jgi:hypothetical protein